MSRQSGTLGVLVSPDLCTFNQVFMQDFEVFVAQDGATLSEKIIAGDTAWCGLERLISGHRHKCSISITPFQTTFVGIVPNQAHKRFAEGIQQSNLHYVLVSSCSVAMLTWICLQCKTYFP